MAVPQRFNVTAQDVYNYLASKVFADQQLCMVLKLSGQVDENSFAKVMRLTLDQEPVLGSRFVENGSNPYWERREDIEQITISALVENSSPEQEIQAFINEAKHADVDPLITSRIFREKKTDTICVKVNHSVCDAGGLKEYVSILSDVYGMSLNNPNYCIKPNLLGRRDQSQVFDSIKDVDSVVPGAGPRPNWIFPQKEGTLPLHSILRLPRERFEAVKKYAHDKKATINDVLLTGLYRAFFEINNTR
jgi:NRPS condensation-like uncharacterized protein